jgi:hypothetical protein
MSTCDRDGAGYKTLYRKKTMSELGCVREIMSPLCLSVPICDGKVVGLYKSSRCCSSPVGVAKSVSVQLP